MSETASNQGKKMKLKPRRTGYSLFCMEKAKEDEVKKMSRPERLRLFGELWRHLSEEAKADYRNRAASMLPPSNLTWRKKEWHKKASKIGELLDKMQELHPTEGFIVLRSEDGTVVTHGTSRGKAFMKEYPGLVTETFRAYLEGPGHNIPLASTVSVKDVQNIFNEKYSLAKRRHGLRFPYSNKNVRMVGLPEGIPFRHPSKYGLRQLRAISAAKDNLRCIIEDTNGNTGHACQTLPALDNSLDYCQTETVCTKTMS